MRCSRRGDLVDEARIVQLARGGEVVGGLQPLLVGANDLGQLGVPLTQTLCLGLIRVYRRVGETLLQ